MMDLFLLSTQLLASQDDNWWISCLDSHTDGTHSLQSIQWWTSDEMLNFSKYHSFIYILDELRVSKFSAIFILYF